jgi:glycosyltransferase involved in cell wall biosynthesis
MISVPSFVYSMVFPVFDRAIFAYFVLLLVSYGTLVTAALWELIGHVLRVRGESRQWVLGSAVSPSISILAPAYHEEATIAESVTALLALHYANLEVVVINDGSPDRTLEVLRDRFALVPVHTIVWRRLDTKPVRRLYRSKTHPNLVVVDKVNGGKADALNVGLNLATGDLVCVIDADTIVDADALPRLARPFLADAATIATGGMIRVANGSQVSGGRVLEVKAPRNPLAGMQVSEYLRAFLFGRLGWNELGGTLIISGAFGLFHREAMIACSGYTHDTVGEDMELVLKLRRRAYEAGQRHRVIFVPDAVAWTEVPETVAVLGRQRDRWHRGLADVLWRHRHLIGNPKYRGIAVLSDRGTARAGDRTARLGRARGLGPHGCAQRQGGAAAVCDCLRPECDSWHARRARRRVEFSALPPYARPIDRDRLVHAGNLRVSPSHRPVAGAWPVEVHARPHRLGQDGAPWLCHAYGRGTSRSVVTARANTRSRVIGIGHGSPARCGARKSSKCGLSGLPDCPRCRLIVKPSTSAQSST